jgi:predicted dehydrogenase
MKELHWGILGTAGIARKNWKAIRHTGNGIVTAVASRELDRSRRFIADCQRLQPFPRPPGAFGSYEELLASSQVDAVYIPLPTALRGEWVVRAARAGKHVVCEKPCAVGADGLKQMLAACRRHRVQFMDGVMFMHHPRLDHVRRVLDGRPGIGPIRRITSVFTFLGNREFWRWNIRLHSGLEPAGCLGDLGWYCLRFTLWAMNWRLPREVTGRIVSQCGCAGSPAPVPTDFSGELVYDDGVSAGFFCSFRIEKQQWVQIGGVNGDLRIADFVHPASLNRPSFEANQSVHRVDVGKELEASRRSLYRRLAHFVSRRSRRGHAFAQDTCLFRNFAEQVRFGRLNDDWPMMALRTQQVMDACFESARRGGRPAGL